jgi:hypothetical protein
LFADWGAQQTSEKVGAAAPPAADSGAVRSVSKYFGAEASYVERTGTAVRKTYFRLRAGR